MKLNDKECNHIILLFLELKLHVVLVFARIVVCHRIIYICTVFIIKSILTPNEVTALLQSMSPVKKKKEK